MPQDLSAGSSKILAVKPSNGFLNQNSVLPYGVKPEHVLAAMDDFTMFLSIVNVSLTEQQLPRLESICMPANFSSIVGEFVSSALTKHSAGIVRNKHHNGHPDLIPVDTYTNDDVLHGSAGIEVKASRYESGWQGHNAEKTFLMVIVYHSDRPKSETETQFRFRGIYAAQLEKSDWSEAPRKATSRRTATASVLKTGYEKMVANWIYRDPTPVGEDSAELDLLGAE